MIEHIPVIKRECKMNTSIFSTKWDTHRVYKQYQWLYTNCGRSHSQMTPEFDAITAVRITRYNKHNFKRIPSKIIWAPGLTNLNSLVLKRSSRLFSHFMNFITLNCIERHCSFGCTPIIGKTRMSSIFCGSRFLDMNYPFLKYM